MQPDPAIVVFSDGKEVLLPLSYQKIAGGVFKRYISSIPQDVTYGGWITKHKLTDDHVSCLISHVQDTYKNLLWRLNPYDELVHNAIASKRNGTTHALFLNDGIDTIVSGFTKGNRKAVMKAEKSGVTIRRGESLDDWKEYYSMYRDSIRRWGNEAFSVQSWRLFELLSSLNSKYIKLWLAEYDNKIIAGRILLYSQNHAISWHGVAHASYFHLRPVNLLHYEIIKDSCSSGYHWYDFGPSGKLKGVRAFKERFGAACLPCGKIRYMTYYQSLVRKGLHGFSKLRNTR